MNASDVEHADTDTGTPTRQAAMPPPTATATAVQTRVVVDELSPRAIEQLRDHIDDASGGGNRFVWFVLGFVMALVAGAVSAVVFLAVSDDDDDGSVDFDVPAVEVDVEP